LAPNVLAEDGSIAIRICKQKFCADLIKAVGVPLIATSANTSGQPSPIAFREIEKEIIEKVDCIAGEDQHLGTNTASSILRIDLDGKLKIIRK
jgi:L-threonylcarbamoyladenylate synthase